MLNIKVFIFSFFIAIGWVLTTLGATPFASDKDPIKALYLYNFLLFVKWPQDTTGNQTSSKNPEVVLRGFRPYGSPAQQ